MIEAGVNDVTSFTLHPLHQWVVLKEARLLEAVCIIEVGLEVDDPGVVVK